MVVGYLRTSTNMQEKGLDSQKRAIKSYVESNKISDISFISDEGISGAKTTRKGLDGLLELCKMGKVQTVICYSFSRISRSTKHLLEIMELFADLGINFISLTEKVDTTSPMGKCFFTIIASINTLERELVSERVKNGLEAAKKRGSRLGRVRSCNDSLILELVAQGMSYRKVANLADCSQSSVSRVVARSKNNNNEFLD